MRNLRRNLQPVFFKLYEGEEEIIDQYGNATGSFIPQYGSLKSAMLCVSPNKGSSEVEQFGSFEDYDRTMTTADVDCEIDEDAVLWIDGADTDGPYNAIVKLTARWKNSVQYAIQHVTVSAYEKQQDQIQQLINQQAAFAKLRAAEKEMQPISNENQSETESRISE